ncbi:MAG: OmpH family outer membrane protein [Phycisphaerae bacterium]
MRPTWITAFAAGLVVGVCVLALTRGLSAQTGGVASGKSVAIDVVQIFNEYQRQKDLAEDIKREQERLGQENQSRRARLDDLRAALDKMSPTDPMYAGKQNEFLRQQIEYKNWFDLNDAAITREVAAWTKKIYLEIVQAATEVAQQGGCDFVFYKDQFQADSVDPNEIRQQIYNRKLLYSAPAVDASPQVLEKLNTAYRAQPRKPMLSIPQMSTP